MLKARCTPTDRGFINAIVLCELAWTLDRSYGYSRAEIAGVIARILENAALEVERRELAQAALGAYESGAPSFADALLSKINLDSGCETTMTFDRKAAKLRGFSLVP